MIKCLGRKIPSTSEILFTLLSGVHNVRNSCRSNFHLSCDLVTFSQALCLSGFLPWLWLVTFSQALCLSGFLPWLWLLLHSARHCVWVGFYLGCDWLLHSARHCVWVGFYLGCDWLRCCPRRTSYRSGYPPRQTRSSPHRYKDWCCAESLEINHRPELRGVTRGYKQCLLGFLFFNRFIDYETSNR